MTGLRYLAGECPPPPHIPEMDVDLGYWAGQPRVWRENGKELHYRCFSDGRQKRSVVVNLNDDKVHIIPGRDAVWFDGCWPNARRMETK